MSKPKVKRFKVWVFWRKKGNVTIFGNSYFMTKISAKLERSYERLSSNITIKRATLTVKL